MRVNNMVPANSHMCAVGVGSTRHAMVNGMMIMVSDVISGRVGSVMFVVFTVEFSVMFVVFTVVFSVMVLSGVDTIVSSVNNLVSRLDWTSVNSGVADLDLDWARVKSGVGDLGCFSNDVDLISSHGMMDCCGSLGSRGRSGNLELRSSNLGRTSNGLETGGQTENLSKTRVTLDFGLSDRQLFSEGEGIYAGQILSEVFLTCRGSLLQSLG